MPDDDDLTSLAAEMNSVAIHLMRRLRRADRSLGVPPGRLSALSVLVFGGPRRLRDLAEAEQVAGPTMSKIVAGLVRSGLVAREVDPSDARAVVLSPTAKGRRLMERGRRQRVDRLVGELRRLPPDDLATLRRAAGILRSLE